MSNQSQPSTEPRSDIKPLEKDQIEEIAQFYGVPKTLIGLEWCTIKGNLYAKVPFHMHQAAKKGYQRIDTQVWALIDGKWKLEGELEKPPGQDTTWKATSTLYPKMHSRDLESLTKLTLEERRDLIAYMTEPMEETATAGKETVKNPYMWPYLREMAITRSIARVCKRFSGYGGTAYEELPEAVLDHNQLEEAKGLAGAKPVGKGSVKQPAGGPTQTLDNVTK